MLPKKNASRVALKSTSTDKSAITELFLPFHSSFFNNPPISPYSLSDHPTMANSPSFHSLLLLLFLFLFVSSAIARPCKTLLISTYDIAEVRPHLFAIVAEFHELNPKSIDFRPFHHPRAFFPAEDDRQTLIRRPEIPLESSSIRDRTVDILSVLASLLFGAACGALTSVAMYLVWSFFNCRFVAYRRLDDGFSDDDEDDVDDIFNPKKVCNNEISKPAAPSTADSVETALLNKESV